MTKTSIVLVLVAFTLALGACVQGSASSSTDTDIPDIVMPGDPLAGAAVYTALCSNCHGRDLQGVTGLGKPLAPSEFVAGTSEDDLVSLIIMGRLINHPDNTTGVSMLPRGGNPSLGDQAIHDVAAYIKAHN